LDKYLPDGVTIEWTNSYLSVRDPVATGHIDIAVMPITNFFYAVENDFPLTPLFAAAGSQAYIYSNNRRIRGFEDIHDSVRIATTAKGGIGTTAINIMSAEKYGDPFKLENNFYVMLYSEMFASLTVSNDIELAMFTLPHTETANKMEGLEKIVDLTPVMKENNLISLYFTSDQFYKKNPKLIEAFMNASYDALNYINENTTEAALFLSEIYNVDPSYIEEEFRAWPLNLEINGYDELASFLYEIGRLTKPPRKLFEFPSYDIIPRKN
jgi:ABC-type nitrate/sulfonate/bicarbonate transport system substrate-binding protein